MGVENNPKLSAAGEVVQNEGEETLPLNINIIIITESTLSIRSRTEGVLSCCVLNRKYGERVAKATSKGLFCWGSHWR